MKRAWLMLCCLFALARPARAAEPLAVWHAYRGDEKAALEQVLAAFEKREGVKVEALQVPHDAYAAKLTAAVPRGHGPDVFIDSHERIGDLQQRGVVALLPREAAGAGFPERALEALASPQGLRGLPLALKCLALYVNQDLVPEVPASLEGFGALRASLPKDVVPLAYETRNMYFHAALLHAFGGAQLAPDESFGFRGQPGVRSLELVQRLMREGVVPEEASGAVVGELFKTGKAATAISGPWFASDIGQSVRYRVVPLPPIEAAGAPMRPFLTVEAASLTPKGKGNPRASRLLAFIAGDDGAELRARVGRQVVARVELPPSAKGDAFLAAFAAQAAVAVPMPSSPRMRTTWEPAERALKKTLSGTVTADAALTEAARRFEDVVRPPPPRRSPNVALVLIGALCLAGAFWLFQRSRGGELGPALRRSLPAYGWVAHAVLAVGALVILPIAVGAGTALFAGRQGEMHYVGLANFVQILTARGGPLLGSGSFYLVLLVTLLWTVANLTLHVGIGFALGLALSRPTLRLKPLYRVLLIIPWAVPSYVTALAWKGMFSRQFGAVSALLEAVGVEPFSWWARFSTAFTANLATNVWLGFPFMMVVTLGALTSVPKEVLEAAEVDGATRWQRLWRVTVPMVVPSMLPAVLLGAIWTFNQFNVVFLVSGGEPDGTTDILVSEAYRWAFTRQAQYGYAAAYAVLIFLLLFVASRLMSRVGRAREAT
ncbi:MAG: extracellular solute-binding protein [Myxococcales bacterium]|nr:extracellular solute-binding protein [Myxococcales bacterium]